MASTTLRATCARDNVIPFPSRAIPAPTAEELEAIEKIGLIQEKIRTQQIMLGWWLREYQTITGRAFSMEGRHG